MRNQLFVAVIAALIIGVAIWIWLANRDNAVEVVSGISAYNQTQDADATIVSANPSDVIVYTLTSQNNSDEIAVGYVVGVNIADLSQLATLTDAQGANYNSIDNTLAWTPIDVPAQGSIEKQFTVKVKETLPQDTDSVMTISFNNEVAVNVNTNGQATEVPPVAGADTESPDYQAPSVGINEWLVVILAIIATGSVFAFRKNSKAQI